MLVGDNSKYRDLLLDYGIANVVQDVYHQNPDMQYKRCLSWLVLNMCRLTDEPMSETTLGTILPIIKEFACHADFEVHIYTCRTNELPLLICRTVYFSFLCQSLSRFSRSELVTPGTAKVLRLAAQYTSTHGDCLKT